ncbi:MAG: hypothetical protein AAGH68_00245 [Pseudomonadota bacterium]
MPGIVKIWWHDGAVVDVRHHDIPVVAEPELGFESVLVSATPANSGPAPADAKVAIVQTDVNLRYQVRQDGEVTLADAENSKPIAATGFGTDAIGIVAGQSISFVEA